jgi:hypothetical protein
MVSKAVTQLRKRLGPTALEEVHKILPIDRVKRLTNTKLEKESRRLVLVEAFGEVLHIEEVVMYASFLDEGVLRI